MKRFILLILFILLIACCITSLTAGTRTIPSTDRMPLGDWTYDAMISLASDGLVPGHAARVFQGDRLFNRMEMASLVALVVRTSNSHTLSAAHVRLIDNLVQEFSPEIMAQDEEVIAQWNGRSADVSGRGLLGTGYIKALEIVKEGQDGTLQGAFRLSGFASIRDNVFALATLAEKEERFYHKFPNNPTLDKAFVRGFDGNFVWSVGREYLNWSPSYSGSLILSDNSAAFVQGRAVREIDLGWFIDRIKVTQFVSAFEDRGDNLVLFGRRYEKPIGKRWSFGLSETAKMSEVPNPLILVLPVYLYQHVLGGPGSATDTNFNALYSLDVLYQMSGGSQIYGEFLVDDMSSPRIFGRDFDRPNKTGFLLGFYTPKALRSDRLSTFRAEYIRINRQTYEATRAEHPELAYTHNGDIIGSPIGPNAEAVYLRGEHYLSDKWSLIGEYFNQRQKDDAPPLRPRIRSLSLLIPYDITPDKSVGLRISSFCEAMPGRASQSGMEYWFRASYAF